MLRTSVRRIDMNKPFVDATLPDGSRLHVVIPDMIEAVLLTCADPPWQVELTRFGGHPELGLQARGRGPGGPTEQVLTGVPGAGRGAGPGDRQDGR